MTCARHADALSDVAAGGPLAAELEAHLASCDACREELRSLQQALAVADEEMARLLTAAPSPDFRARIRSAVAESEARPERFGRLWSAAAVAAALLVALVVVVGRAPSRETSVATAPASLRPEVAPGRTERERAPALGPAAAAPAHNAQDPDTRRLVRRAGTRRTPEVVVPPGETEALLRLVALVHGERLAPPVLGSVGQPSADLAEPRPIDIQPLEIVPLDPAETSGT